jgi:FSR family fosmidomycin resistance protein-like MFS transporter
MQLCGTVQSSSSQVQQEMSTEFHTEQIVTIAGGHVVHDTYTAFIAPLLPLLRERLGIGYALAGGLTIFTQIPSLLNPLIGYLADRMSLRYFVIFAPALTATLVSCLGLANNYLSLVLLLLLAGVSVAGFHAPAPVMIAQVAGRRVGTGMGIFMAAGELGRTLGPVAVIAAVGWFGLEGLWRASFVGWAVSGVLYWRLRNVQAKPSITGGSFLPWNSFRKVFPALTWLMLARTLMHAGLTVFLPLFMTEVRQSSLWLAAAALTILEAGGVIGALGSGIVSDRSGRARVLLVLFFLAPLLMLAFLIAPSWMSVPLLFVLGLTAISPTPIFLAIVQEEFTESRALANGTFMALNFLTRSLGVWVAGLMADSFGLERVLLLGALVAFAALPAVWFLRRNTVYK